MSTSRAHPGSSPPLRRPARHALCCAVLAALSGVDARAQTDSATVVAGTRYEPENELHGRLLGEEYRELWTTPIRVPILDLSAFAGGLTPVRAGGFKQTQALRLRGADGREYNFRPVDKELTGGLPDYAKETVVDWVRQDQTAAQLPVAPIVATALLDAVGLLNPGPQLFVMPNDARLGEFRARFAGVLGTIETEGGSANFANAEQVVGTERLLEHLEEGPEHRVDSRTFLKARLMDVFINDYDRHGGQWRWGAYDADGTRWWVPIGEDRDCAFVSYEGLLLDIGRLAGIRRAIRFEESYPNLLAMVENSLGLTRRLLAELPREVWDSLAVDLQTTLTDEVIAAAVARMPAPYIARRGPELIRKLRARRDAMREMAAELYALHAETVEIHATDEPDRADVVRRADGTLEVRLSRLGGDAAGSYFRRVVLPGETSEVRILMHGGDDHARIEGSGSDIAVRVIGGGGDDLLEDASAGPTVLYDSRRDNRFVRGRKTRVSERPAREPEDRDDLLPTFIREAGTSRSVAPFVDWRSHAEAVVGAELSQTRYAFRYAPYQTKLSVRALYAPLHTRYGLEAEGTFHRESSAMRLELFARASNMEATIFHGFGNDSERQTSRMARVWHDRLLARALLHTPVARTGELAVGPVIRHTRPSAAPGSPAAISAPFGMEALTEVGAHAALAFDTRDAATFPRRGARAEVTTQLYPAVSGLQKGFGRLDARASTYLPLRVPFAPVLAIRAGGSRMFGAFPFYEAAFLGGSHLLRGYGTQRFTGDLSLFGGADLRVPVTPLELVVRGDAGVVLFTDAGRVFLDGESPGGWHASAGGGIWFASPVGAVSLTYARGEANRVYLKLGMAF